MCKKSTRFARDIEHLPSIAIAEAYLTAVFILKGDAKNALIHAEKSMKCCTEAGVDLLLPFTNLYFGFGYLYLSELQTAAKFMQRALQIQKDTGFQYFMSAIYGGLGFVNMLSGNFNSAQNYTEKALSYAQKNSEKLFEGLAWTLLGRIFGKKKPAELDKGKEYIEKAIKKFEEIKAKPYISQGYLCLGDLYNDMGRKGEAVEHLKKAEGMFQEMGMKYWLNRTKEVLAKV